MRTKCLALGLVVVGVMVCAAGIHVGHTDDAPGAAIFGIVLMIGAVTLGEKMVQRET